MGDSKTEFGLIGKGLHHSFSAKYFNGKFKAEDINATYSLFDLPDITLLPEVLEKHPRLKGLNVTSPYKRLIIPYLDSLSPEAEELNAVNTIEFSGSLNGRPILRGHNTDSPGFGLTLPSLPFPIKRAIVLGTGGASSAVILALKNAGIPYLQVSRYPHNDIVDYNQLRQILSEDDLIINATPVGMFPNVKDCPDIPYEILSARNICYDLIYNPEQTLFMKKAEEMGATTLNGLDMLINQAELSWKIWNG